MIIYFMHKYLEIWLKNEAMALEIMFTFLAIAVCKAVGYDYVVITIIAWLSE